MIKWTMMKTMMKMVKTAALGAGLTALCFGVAPATGFAAEPQTGTARVVSGPAPTLTIASETDSENRIDDYIVAEYLQAKTPLKVNVVLTSGYDGLMHSMMMKGNIQLYVNYDGTEFTGPLGQSYTGKFRGRPDLVSQYVKTNELKKFGVWVSPSLGYEDTYALAVRADTAKQYHLKNDSDVLPYSKNWVLGTEQTFQAREGDGLADFEKAYNMTFKSARAMDYDLMYTALANRTVDAIVAYSTDGRLRKFNEVTLSDNKHFFPPYHAIVLINAKTEKQYHLGQVLKPLFGAISTEDQIQMNYEADVLKKDLKAIAHEFLVKKGLIRK
ncbi:MAG: hypothetical protein K6T83_19290 [Alicyclobacillus sp.]|nr:hypothetical protein [Alicyclobacillus sp.]